jgi:hypothetical protein
MTLQFTGRPKSYLKKTGEILLAASSAPLSDIRLD